MSVRTMPRRWLRAATLVALPGLLLAQAGAALAAPGDANATGVSVALGANVLGVEVADLTATLGTLSAPTEPGTSSDQLLGVDVSALQSGITAGVLDLDATRGEDGGVSSSSAQLTAPAVALLGADVLAATLIRAEAICPSDATPSTAITISDLTLFGDPIDPASLSGVGVEVDIEVAAVGATLRDLLGVLDLAALLETLENLLGTDALADLLDDIVDLEDVLGLLDLLAWLAGTLGIEDILDDLIDALELDDLLDLVEASLRVSLTQSEATTATTAAATAIVLEAGLGVTLDDATLADVDLGAITIASAACEAPAVLDDDDDDSDDNGTDDDGDDDGDDNGTDDDGDDDGTDDDDGGDDGNGGAGGGGDGGGQTLPRTGGDTAHLWLLGAGVLLLLGTGLSGVRGRSAVEPTTP